MIGDEKTPEEWWCKNANFYSGYGSEFVYKLPVNHYARKNMGYLVAMEQGYDCIYDTDDDNIPNENWKLRERQSWAMSATDQGWMNVYRKFTSDNVWPRGLPLKYIHQWGSLSNPQEVISPIQQGLADKSSDVDAIWRLVFDKENEGFNYQRSAHLPKGTWCPFNSQSTWWFKEAFPLMYLPQYCSFRMTDIWRSFVAQRCLWEMGYGVVFHSPAEVVQERNPHDLMRDFEDEIPGYLNNDKIKEHLDTIELGKDVYENIYECYWELCRIGILPKEEMTSLKQWIGDCKNILNGKS